MTALLVWCEKAAEGSESKTRAGLWSAQMMSATSSIIRAPRLLTARALKTVTNPPGVRRDEEFSQDTCKIWRKFEECAAIGYHHLLRIASNSPIQARIRIGHALTPTKI